MKQNEKKEQDECHGDETLLPHMQVSEEDRSALVNSIDSPTSWGTFVVSSVTREGLPALCEALWSQVELGRERSAGPDDQFPDLDEWKP